jgi:hypothetical protein
MPPITATRITTAAAVSPPRPEPIPPGPQGTDPDGSLWVRSNDNEDKDNENEAGDHQGPDEDGNDDDKHKGSSSG